MVADCLSRVDAIRLASDVSLLELSKAQIDDPELKALCQDKSTCLNLRRMLWGTDHTPIVCDLSGEILRPYVPKVYCKRVFDIFHNPSHPSAKISGKNIGKSYIWPGMNKDIRRFYFTIKNNYLFL